MTVRFNLTLCLTAKTITHRSDSYHRSWPRFNAFFWAFLSL